MMMRRERAKGSNRRPLTCSLGLTRRRVLSPQGQPGPPQLSRAHSRQSRKAAAAMWAGNSPCHNFIRDLLMCPSTSIFQGNCPLLAPAPGRPLAGQPSDSRFAVRRQIGNPCSRPGSLTCGTLRKGIQSHAIARLTTRVVERTGGVWNWTSTLHQPVRSRKL